MNDTVTFVLIEVSIVNHSSYDYMYSTDIGFEYISKYGTSYTLSRDEFRELEKAVNKLNSLRSSYDSKIQIITTDRRGLTPDGIIAELKEIQDHKAEEKRKKEAAKKKAAETRKKNQLEKKRKQLEKLKKELEQS